MLNGLSFLGKFNRGMMAPNHDKHMGARQTVTGDFRVPVSRPARPSLVVIDVYNPEKPIEKHSHAAFPVAGVNGTLPKTQHFSAAENVREPRGKRAVLV